jgi:hypothetical protein
MSMVRVNKAQGRPMKWIYGVLCVLGIVLPYWQFVPWLMLHGLDAGALVREAAQLRIGAFAWLDVLVSGIALIVFIRHEGQRLAMRRTWMPIVGTLLVGVSLGLPLFLLMREGRLLNTER